MAKKADDSVRVGIDIGGTFTDLSILDSSGIRAVGKALTTHDAPADGVMTALRDALTASGVIPTDVRGLVHGTTLVTNALIERRGATTAVVTNEGFRDVIEMGREHRYDLYDLEIELPRPLVNRELRFTLNERTLSDGIHLRRVDADEVRQLAKELSARNVEAVAVCLLHSHINAESERLVREILEEELPEVRIALSSEINPEIREYERFSTTIANVYVQRVVEDYLDDLRHRLTDADVPADPRIMLSNGGVTSIDIAKVYPIRMLESGPAGGALGAVAFGEANGEGDLLAFDMGGTTAKACLIQGGEPLVTHSFEVNRLYRLKQGSGLPVRAPVIDMIEIGAGGGSIAKVDALGMISVGPESAGSDPGPACYGLGGEYPTVTDADLVLGYLGAGSFLGGRMSLDMEAARTAIERYVAKPLGVTVEQAAWGIHASVNENMANAARIHAIERGVDIKQHGMFASGGNGPLHGPGVAHSLGLRFVLVPPAAGVLSTLGFLAAVPSIDVTRAHYAPLGPRLKDSVGPLLKEMEAEGEQLLRDSGVDAADVEHRHTVDMRFEGQGQEVEVSVPPMGESWQSDLEAAFRSEYERRYGTVVFDGIGMEVLTFRTKSSGPQPSRNLRLAVGGEGPAIEPQSRGVYFADERSFVEVPVVSRYSLSAGAHGVGPALIEETESTTAVPDDAEYSVLEDGSIRIDFGKADS
ncbi:hydantoinase/oxoprolinase family protein [Brevibacterium luteolum]|uniref:Hydantoinase/oxoprolinase family protein n=1 Tax=Brevibacterium luteolum TaxID=199591 RepID=A0A6G8L0B5_9MICO|nr:hydantoinase/oxoprolinase family protein [Brevibacterium luteolum]QIN30190.1 hydantoinase/oxoprolinase family protein [Brevibacterium luteolum]